MTLTSATRPCPKPNATGRVIDTSKDTQGSVFVKLEAGKAQVGPTNLIRRDQQ
jgi:hypothetical protein